jgi:hypothetical protein
MPRANFKDLTGLRFGRLLVTGRGENTAVGQARWICSCDCGKETLVHGYSLRGGLSNSCGCLQRLKTSTANKTHGQTKTSLYRIWAGMFTRCYDKNHRTYKWYGGRGITVCPRWKSFENFSADMGPRPGNLTLDRINNDGNYELSNCRWASVKEQNTNRRPRKPAAYYADLP